jgi:phosphoglycolate phosphatase-like HAD superfamily hydrolase/prolipoprotein diacylglyceryltransferase
MVWFPDSSTIVTVGGVYIHWYAVTLVLGFIAGFFYLSRKMKDHGYQQRTADDLFLVAIVFGVFAGRVGWILENFKNYSMYAWYMLSIFDGGTEVLTAIFGMAIGVFLYTKKNHMSFRRTIDIVLVAELIISTIAKTGRCLENPSTWLVVAFNCAALAILYGIRTWNKGRRRGDLASIGFMLAGMSRLLAYVFKLDTLAVNCLWVCIASEAVGLCIYIFARNVKDTKPVILLDFDGTIMDSEGMVIGCYAYIFQKFGNLKDFTRDVQLEVLSLSLKDAMEKLFPDQNPELLVREYRDFQKSLPGKHLVNALPHTEETLKKLKEEGYVVGIVTSRISSSCESWLEDLGLRGYVDAVVGTEKIRHMKPAPDGILVTGEVLNTGHDACVYIGDSVTDVLAGKNAGVYTVGLLSYPEKEEKIIAAKPNETIKDLQELLPILEEQHAWSYTKI